MCGVCLCLLPVSASQPLHPALLQGLLSVYILIKHSCEGIRQLFSPPARRHPVCNQIHNTIHMEVSKAAPRNDTVQAPAVTILMYMQGSQWVDRGAGSLECYNVLMIVL